MTDDPDRPRIDRLWPRPEPNLDDAALVADLSSDSPVLRVNFVASVDGSATQEGRSGGLSGDADKRYFELLRRVSDVVLVGAGTVRTEGYGALRVSDDSVRWRVAHGLSEHPVFAIVSRSLDLDPVIVAEAPVRPILFTIQDAQTPAALAAADVVVAGIERVEGRRIVAALAERGLETVLCEGGPHLFASLLDDDVVDELCLTVSPVLEPTASQDAGDDIRITAELTMPRQLELTSILSAGSTLLLRYRRERAN